MSKEFLVSLISTLIGFTLAQGYEDIGTKVKYVIDIVLTVFVFCLVIGVSAASYLGLKVNFDTLKRQPTLVLWKIVKSLIVIALVITIGAILRYEYDLNERTVTMGGAAILLGGLGAIWKSQKTTRRVDDSAKQNKQKQ
jgi:uncharacterized BrkB/YihY/UPF0761 family membrane protein